MTQDKFWTWLNDSLFTAGMNVEYYQRSADSWHWWDRAATIFVVVVSMLALFASRRKAWGKIADVLGWLGVLVPSILFVVPFGQWASQADVFAVQWSDLRASLGDIKNQFVTVDKSAPLPRTFLQEMAVMDAKKNQIQANEGTPNDRLLKDCYAIQCEKTYGKGIKSAEDVRDKLKQDDEQPKPPPPSLPSPRDKSVSTNVIK